MEKFTTFLNRQNSEYANVEEIVGILLASACLAYACAPSMIETAKATVSFWDFLRDRQSKKDKDSRDSRDSGDSKDSKNSKDSKDSEDSKDSKDNENNKIFNSLLMLSKKANKKEKDEHTKKKNDALIKILTACSFDKDGQEIPIDERIEKMKDVMTPEQFEAFKKDMKDTYEKVKDDPKYKDAMKKAKESIKPEDYDKYMEDSKKEASETFAQLEKEKKEIIEHEKQIKEIQAQIDGADGDEKDEEIKKLKEELEELKKNAPQTLTTAASGVTGGGTPTKPAEPAEPKEKTKEEKDAEIKAIEDEYKQKSKALEDEYNQKIKDESDPDKKKELEDEWAKKEKALTAEKNKKQDDIDDTDEHKDDDETKQGKYTVKDEEIEDENGKKIKVKTYTGPRGGKFYYPEGKPHTPEHKVYVESIQKKSLSEYLMSQLAQNFNCSH